MSLRESGANKNLTLFWPEGRSDTLKHNHGFGNIERQAAVAGAAIYLAIAIPGLLGSISKGAGVSVLLVVKYGWPLVVIPLVALGLHWQAQKSEPTAGWTWGGYQNELLGAMTIATMLLFLVGLAWGVWGILRSLFSW